jgi:predicted dehydrogenase
MTDRREFLRDAALAAAGLTLAVPSARGFLANETLQVGCVGTGGRCRTLMKPLSAVPGVKITAVCDVFDANLEEGRKLADTKAFTTKDYKALLARSDVDAVLVGTPDHWHVPLTVESCAAGKDVYVEKPLTHDLSEGAAVVKAQNDHKRVVQVGMQQRSMPHLKKAAEIIKAGGIGKVHKVTLSWNRNSPRARRPNPQVDPKTVDWKRFLGNAKEQPFDEYRFRQWRWFWDFGGGIFTDLMVHWIDVVNWFLDLDHPATAASVGDFFSAKYLWETPDTVQTLMRYPEKDVQVHFEGTFSNARRGAMVEFMGTDATLYCDRGRYEVVPERNSKVKADEMILGDGPRGLDFYNQPDGELLHLTDWVAAVRSRKTPAAPAEAGVKAAAAAHLANRSLRAGKIVTWDDVKP